MKRGGQFRVVGHHPEFDVPPGRMDVIGDPSPVLRRALGVIETHLHPLLDAALSFHGKSKESCILCSETVRAFLYRVGLKDARVASVFFYLDARRDGELVRSVGIGDPKGHGPEWPADRWNGHAVVLADGFLIDTTLYPAQRPQFDLAGMMAVKLFPTDRPAQYCAGHPVLTGLEGRHPENTEVAAMWADQPGNDAMLLSAPDRVRKHTRDRVAQQMLDLYRAAP